MNCGDFRYLVQRRFDTELSPADDRALLIHLEACESCQRFYHQVQQVIIAAEELELTEDILPHNPQQLSASVLENIPKEKQGIKALFMSLLGRFGMGHNNNGDGKSGLISSMNEAADRKRLPPLPSNSDPVTSGNAAKKFNGQAGHPLMAWGQAGSQPNVSPSIPDERSERSPTPIKVPDEQVSTRSLGEKFGISGASSVLNPNQPLSLAESIRQKIAEMSKAGGDYSSTIPLNPSSDPITQEPMDEWSIPHSPQWPKLDPDASPDEWKSEVSGAAKAPNTWGNPAAGWGKQPDILPAKKSMEPAIDQNIAKIEINAIPEINVLEKNVAAEQKAEQKPEQKNEQKDEQPETHQLGWSIEAEQMETGTWQTVQFDTTLGATGYVSPSSPQIFPTLNQPVLPNNLMSSSNQQALPPKNLVGSENEKSAFPNNLMPSAEQPIPQTLSQPPSQPPSQPMPLSAVVESMAHSTPKAIQPETLESVPRAKSGSMVHSTTQSIAALDDSEFVLPEGLETIPVKSLDDSRASPKDNGVETDKNDLQSFVPSGANPKIYPVVSRRARTALPFSKPNTPGQPPFSEPTALAEAPALLPAVAAMGTPVEPAIPLALIPERMPLTSAHPAAIPTSTFPAASAAPPVAKAPTVPPTGIDSLLESLVEEVIHPSGDTVNTSPEILNKQEKPTKPETKITDDTSHLFNFDDGAIDQIFSNNLGIHERSMSTQSAPPSSTPQPANVIAPVPPPASMPQPANVPVPVVPQPSPEQSISPSSSASESSVTPLNALSSGHLPNSQNPPSQALPIATPSIPNLSNLDPSIPMPSIRGVTASGSSIAASSSIPTPPIRSLPASSSASSNNNLEMSIPMPSIRAVSSSGSSNPVAPNPVAPNPVAENPVAANLVAPNPVAENPVAANLVAPNPVAENPVAANLVAPNPVTANPVAANPIAENPVASNLVAPNPVTANPVAANPIAENPVASNLVAPNPVTANPVAANPIAANPVAENPIAPNPVTANPVAANPVAPNPVAANPVAANPVAANRVAANPVAANPVTPNPVAKSVTPNPVTPNPVTPKPIAPNLSAAAPNSNDAQANNLFAVDDNMIDRIFSDRLGVSDQGSKNVVNTSTVGESQLPQNPEPRAALPIEPQKISRPDFMPPSTTGPLKLPELPPGTQPASSTGEDSPQFGGSNKHSPTRQKISGVGRLDSRVAAANDPGSGRISSIGKFLLDSKDLEKIGRLTSADLSDGKTRTLTLEANEELKHLLKQIDAQAGVLGTVIVGHDGLLIAHTMSQDGDAESLGVEALAIYMGTLQVVEKLGDDNVRQIVSRTNQGYLIVANFGAGLLVTLTNPLMLDGLLPLMRTITQLVAA